MDEKIGQFLKKNAPYIAAGLVGLYVLYSYIGGSSTSGTSGTSTTSSGTSGTSTTSSVAGTAADPNVIAAQSALAITQAQGQVQYAIAATQAQAAVQLASINDSANVATEQTLASAQAYETNIAATQSVANTAIGATAGQNIAAYNALATGFSNYMVGSANEVATAAAATGNIAASNNNTGTQVAQDIGAVANLVSAAYGMGSGYSGYMNTAYGNVLQPATTIPIFVGQPNGVNPAFYSPSNYTTGNSAQLA